jgi:hypothetical protein
MLLKTATPKCFLRVPIDATDTQRLERGSNLSTETENNSNDSGTHHNTTETKKQL